MKIPVATLLLVIVVSLSSIVLAQTPTQTSDKTTLIEKSESLPTPPRGTLATMAYKPTEKESVFFSKLADKEKVTGSMLGDYSITGKKGINVGWFGIVRKIAEDPASGQTNLLIEHKYFDGLTDTHILALSFSGSGDFTATLFGTGLGIKLLSLVKVYASVIAEDNFVPTVQSDYVRIWDWGQFTFMDFYGEQKGNKEWQKLNKVKDRIYNPFPNQRYYEDRLGPRKP